MSSYSYQHINICLSRNGLPRMQSVVYFPFVFSFCAHENVSLCFTSWAFINHSSALCFVTDNITATSWQREDERTERQREKESFFPLFFFPLQPPYHLYWNLKIGPLNIFNSPGESTGLYCGWGGMTWGTRRLNKQKKRHRKKKTSSDWKLIKKSFDKTADERLS